MTRPVGKSLLLAVGYENSKPVIGDPYKALGHKIHRNRMPEPYNEDVSFLKRADRLYGRVYSIAGQEAADFMCDFRARTGFEYTWPEVVHFALLWNIVQERRERRPSEMVTPEKWRAIGADADTRDVTHGYYETADNMECGFQWGETVP